MRLVFVLGRVWLLRGCLPDGMRSLTAATASDPVGRQQGSVWPVTNAASKKLSSTFTQLKQDNLAPAAITETTHPSCQWPFPENDIAGESKIVTLARTDSIPEGVALTTRAAIDDFWYVVDDVHEPPKNITVECQTEGANRRRDGSVLAESTSVALAASTLLPSVVPAPAFPPNEEKIRQESGVAANLRPILDRVDRDNRPDERKVPAHTAHDKPTRPLETAAPMAAAFQLENSPPPSALSGRELAVVKLVTSGRSNREIAEELVISKKTAEAHVSHILTKLGLWRRVQIATWSMQHGVGLPDTD
jgi:DNA-binding CsgD family transcriptional regulator